MPTVAARANPRPRSEQRGFGFVVEVPHDFEVVGDETDQEHHHGLGAVVGEGVEVVADVGFVPRDLRVGPSGTARPGRSQ